jgi:ABC-type nickel/cobalt efflux system permease component RcnA
MARRLPKCCRLFAAAVSCAILCASVTLAHPVPDKAHLRSATLSLRPNEICIRYRVEMGEFTAFYEDTKGLFGEAEMKTFNTPRKFYEEFIRRIGPVLADQMVVTLDGQALPLHCIEQRFDVTDHLVCSFVFQADWILTPGREYQLKYHDGTYESEPGRLRLSLDEDRGIDVHRRTIPNSILQSRSPTDLKPGDDKRLRTIQSTFRFAGASTGPTKPVPPAPPATSELPPAAANSTLMKLLDAPHGLAVLLLLATLFGAAHALTPGHGKTLVAAYLVGERGTVWHALILGLTTTLTHTGTVLVIAAGLWWWFPNAVPAKIQSILGFVGGLTIAGLGFWLLLKRLSGGPDHIHGPGGHTHNPDGSITFSATESAGWARLVLLGISGGIIPCWDAIAMLGFAIVAQRLWLALPLLLAFSSGLAGVLVLIGIAIVCAQGRIGTRWSESRIWKMLPLVSAAFLLVMGLWLCHDSLSIPPSVGAKG